MATIFVDNQAFAVDPGQNLLHVCLSLGFDLPYFCWHPAMGSVGACRQCAVKQYRNEQDTKGKLVMACMTPAADGTRISIADAEATAFRKSVIEGLMLNHPHDCPVCDEGGECHLQDMTLMTGHDYRRSRFSKRTFRNQYLGPFVAHEMNRCIQCYRCVRFYRDYAGGRDLNSYALRNTVYFGRQQDGVLQSEFAGNLVEVCPTGVFTDATLGRHYARKWDLQMAPSICPHCAVGCNTTPGERYGTLRRIVNRYNGEVNGYFLCDRGRFGYEFVNSPRRLRKATARPDGGAPAAIEPDEALRRVRALLAESGSILGIGSPRASLESNFILRRLVGPERFFSGMSDDEHRLMLAIVEIYRKGPALIPTPRQIEQCDAVFVLGEDLANTAPRVALGLRQSVRQRPMQLAHKLHIPPWLDQAVREAIQDERGPLFVATPAATRLDEIAAAVFRGAPDDLARLGFAVAHLLDPASPAVPVLSEEMHRLAGEIAAALKGADQPLVISGPGCQSELVLHAAANVARALHGCGKRAYLSFAAPESNSFGVALMGGRGLGEALAAVHADATIIVLENELYRRAPKSDVDRLLSKGRVIVLDCLAGRTAQAANVALPAASFAESDGTFVSHEGRAQRFFRVLPPAEGVQESWRWLLQFRPVAERSGPEFQNLDDVLRALAAELPSLDGVIRAAPLAATRLRWDKVAREPHRYSGRTAMYANAAVAEPKPPDDPDAPLTFSMEGWPAPAPPPLIPFFWSPGWNSIQSVNKFQSEVNGPLRGGDPGIRLIEPAAAEGRYFSAVPEPFQARNGQWLLVPIYHVFGSEELSAYAPAVAELFPKPHVLLSRQDSARLGIVAGTEIELRVLDTTWRLPVEVSDQFPTGLAGIPCGVGAPSAVTSATWSEIRP